MTVQINTLSSEAVLLGRLLNLLHDLVPQDIEKVIESGAFNEKQKAILKELGYIFNF